jgi:hypothetical protein
LDNHYWNKKLGSNALFCVVGIERGEIIEVLFDALAGSLQSLKTVYLGAFT